MAENTNLLNPASNNFFSEINFLYKAIFVSILVLVIPLFIPASTQEAPPDFVNKTTSWEVVQLVLVGIAVSYGLFSSKRNDQPKTLEKEDEHDQHAPLSYVSRLLQVPSSVFDDDNDDEKHMVENNTKVVERTWNSQYYRGEPPIVVVAKESPSVDDANTTIEKLCLPPSVGRGRSLKPSPNNNNNNNNTKEGDNYYYYRKSLSSNSGSSSSFSTGTGKRRFSRNLSCPEEESKEEDNIVLRSPVPWRSRSGSMQLKEEEEKEIQSKSLNEDVAVRKKMMYPQSSTIPTPPPPPPPRPPQRLLLNNNKSRINTSTTRYAPHNQDSQNRARQGGRLVEDVTPTHKYHHTLSHDKEIESFIQTRGGSQKKNNMDDGADDDDDDEDDTKTRSFKEHPKKQQRQASASSSIKDSDQSSTSSEDSEDEEDNDDELQELASTKNSHVINEEEMMLGSDHNVDKKADEFIAKFREQIRLQRIASIRSTATTQAKTKTGPATR